VIKPPGTFRQYQRRLFRSAGTRFGGDNSNLSEQASDAPARSSRQEEPGEPRSAKLARARQGKFSSSPTVPSFVPSRAQDRASSHGAPLVKAKGRAEVYASGADEASAEEGRDIPDARKGSSDVGSDEELRTQDVVVKTRSAMLQGGD